MALSYRHLRPEPSQTRLALEAQLVPVRELVRLQEWAQMVLALEGLLALLVSVA